MLWLCVHLPQCGDLAALERLAAWAYQWSSLVSYRHCPPTASLWLESGASAALFGGHQALFMRIEAELRSMEYGCQLGLAPSAEGAALLARASAHAALNRCAFSHAELRQRIAPLPLQLLALPDATLAALSTSGLGHIGEVLQLPPASIARRFGPQISLHLRQLCGEAPDPRLAWRLPLIYRTRHEFGFEVFHSGALLFPLQRLLWEFQGYLRASDRAVPHFMLRLEHHRQAASSIVVGLSRPSRDAAQFMLLIKEHLARAQLAGPVTGLGLEALEFTAPDVAQADFFGTEAQQLRQLQLLLDRLIARLGQHSVQRLQMLSDHRPERAWRFSTSLDAHAVSVFARAGARPCWLLPQPHRIEAPANLNEAERIESGWWDGGDVARDYYRVRSSAGEHQWVFRNLRDGLWYLQGLWA